MSWLGPLFCFNIFTLCGWASNGRITQRLFVGSSTGFCILHVFPCERSATKLALLIYTQDRLHGLKARDGVIPHKAIPVMPIADLRAEATASPDSLLFMPQANAEWDAISTSALNDADSGPKVALVIVPKAYLGWHTQLVRGGPLMSDPVAPLKCL